MSDCRKELENVVNDLSSILILFKRGFPEEARKVAENSMESVLKFLADMEATPHPKPLQEQSDE